MQRGLKFWKKFFWPWFKTKWPKSHEKTFLRIGRVSKATIWDFSWSFGSEKIVPGAVPPFLLPLLPRWDPCAGPVPKNFLPRRNIAENRILQSWNENEIALLKNRRKLRQNFQKFFQAVPIIFNRRRSEWLRRKISTKYEAKWRRIVESVKQLIQLLQNLQKAPEIFFLDQRGQTFLPPPPRQTSIFLFRARLSLSRSLSQSLNREIFASFGVQIFFCRNWKKSAGVWIFPPTLFSRGGRIHLNKAFRIHLRSPANV